MCFWIGTAACCDWARLAVGPQSSPTVFSPLPSRFTGIPAWPSSSTEIVARCCESIEIIVCVAPPRFLGRTGAAGVPADGLGAQAAVEPLPLTRRAFRLARRRPLVSFCPQTLHVFMTITHARRRPSDAGVERPSRSLGSWTTECCRPGPAIRARLRNSSHESACDSGPD